MLFDRSWQYVGHVGMLEPPVTHFPAVAGGKPVIVTRAGDGDLHAFLNVCAHRGSVVCEAAGNRDRLQCPYHAWTYGLDGALLNAPRSDREEGFDREAHFLEPLSVDTWGPFIFVAGSPDVAPLTEALGSIPEQVGEVLDVGGLAFNRRVSNTYRANWKLCVENFLECYHCRVAHPSFVQVVETGPDDYLLMPTTEGSSQYGPVRQTWSGGFDPIGPIARSQFHLFHPNTAINIFPGHSNLSIGPISPTGTGTTDRFLDYFFGPDVDEAWIDSLLVLDDAVGREDLILVESVQRGMEAAGHRSGTLFLDSETLIAHFRDYVRSAVEQ